MKMLSCCVFGLSLATCSVCLAQIDIYQSDAYSVEEMCAREAEQNTETDYNEAYDSCIANNRDKPMYQSDAADVDTQSSEENYSEDDTGWTESHGENSSDQEFSQDQQM